MSCRHTWVTPPGAAWPWCSTCGEPARASPSQIETFAGGIGDDARHGGPFTLGCPRKWAFDRVLPRGPQNPWAAFGDRVHKIRELWLLHGTPPDTSTKEGRCAVQGLDRLPMPGQAWGVEVVVRTAVVDGAMVDLIGGLPHFVKIDVVAPPPAGSTADVEVIDHKSTGDLARAKTGDMLRWDPQWITYGRAMVDRGARRVAGRWEYLQRDGRGDLPVRIEADASEIVDRHDELSRRVTLPMLQSNGIDPFAFPRNTKRCAAFGPRNLCDRHEVCWVGENPLTKAAALSYTGR